MDNQNNPDIREICRKLRQHSTKAEKIFWEVVRNRKVMNRKFVRQFPIRFKYDGQYRFFIADFYCHEKRLVVEIDGGIHETQKDYDNLRTEIINRLGITVIRFQNESVLHAIDDVIQRLKTHL